MLGDDGDEMLPLPFPTGRRYTSPVRFEVGARSAWLYGPGLAATCDEVGVARMRDWHPGRKGVLMCAVDRVDDLLAILEHRDGRYVDLVTVDR